ncbi:hypothetical protein [Marinimicrobium locisalis]|uniref:hypothetical protein n=1 Tax=Marinimicrobium locisalis TaxID=546022 RepID=UPI003221B3EC
MTNKHSPHEVSDADPRLILWMMVLTVIIVLAGSGLLWLGWLHLDFPKDNPGKSDWFGAEQPRLQTQPAKDFTKQETQWKHQLESAGWINREEGVVHMPIEQAMALLIQRRGAKEEAEESKP